MIPLQLHRLMRCLAPLGAALVLVACDTAPKEPRQSAPTARETALSTVTADYASPEDAVAALKVVLANPNPNAAATLFGPRWSELQLNPDEAPRMRAAFLARLAKGQRIDRVGDGAILVVGASDDPDQFAFAVPLRERKGRWSWDTDAGIEEFRLRRLGRNELETIQAMQAIAAAQRAYFDSNPQGAGAKAFATRLNSSKGRKDGLHWPTAGTEEPAPIGAALAAADCSGTSNSSAIPFKGYRYAMLTPQGNGQSWAAIAWPDAYGTSGIMCFMVGPDGVVFERDLGNDTPRALDVITAFDPTKGWTRCDQAAKAQ
ncbi:MAG: DUF2950 domain-containing protein [Phycisphaerales bacterium]|nr:DUF2950 domain-containing protein [Phycisphaerales bacterium]